MLQNQVLKMVQGRRLRQQLPVALELWNGEELYPSEPAMGYVQLNLVFKGAMRDITSEGLEYLDAECLRPHYARTLWHWLERLKAHSEAAKEIVGEEKYRVW